ncbi:MAG TPA: putative quinol monooxygenase [Solirubrobacteraceae bacterium]
MIVVRFKVQCRSDKADELMAALREVIAPSREVEGVVSFDIGRDLSDPDAFIATEVFEDEAALERQEAQSQVARVMELLPECVAAPPEATLFEVSESKALA